MVCQLPVPPPLNFNMSSALVSKKQHLTLIVRSFSDKLVATPSHQERHPLRIDFKSLAGNSRNSSTDCLRPSSAKCEV
ncbi:hypothetical protein JTE90_028482 [Oedothorax gibbosus]|uniref:Uncharacterized protein n=1 Tax=Oedothorax gibbosus TaxID=931172 RepID=A0AAV6VX24_9ARAC|nr:hypothetical protein JTE90_028482 [Oedothorax gibbosus]